MSTTPEIVRAQQAEDHRDQLQAQVDRLDALDNALADGLSADLRREWADITAAIHHADVECEAAELAFYRSEGDADKVRELESNRVHRDLVAAEAAQAIMDDLRHQHGDDDDADDDAEAEG
jgi:hypothetical protein